MQEVNLNCGIIPNFFSRQEADAMMAVFKKIPATDGDGNHCHGINSQHLAYPWFKQAFLNRLATQFQSDLRLIFGMMLDCHIPFTIHNDIKPLPEPGARHYMSCLMPYSVDNDVALVDRASTIVFNETLDDFEPQTVADNSVQYHHSALGHIPVPILECFSVKQILTWRTGDLVWWDSQLAHTSNDFPGLGHQSKQCIVAHTYLPATA